MHAPLQLLSLNEVPGDYRRQFCPAVHWIALSALLAAVVFCVWLAIERTAWGWWGVFWLGGFWLLLVHTALKTRHPDAWLLRLSDSGAYIKWRSYQNVAHGREGLQVVFLPFASIVSARSHRRSWATPAGSAGGNREVRHRFLELRLHDSLELGTLEKCLGDERGGRLPGTGSVWHHYPVSLEANRVLRVEWDARPSIKTLLEDLRTEGIRIDEDLRSEADLTGAATRDATRHAAVAGELQELARRGDLIALVRVLRVRDRMLDLAQAREQAQAMIGNQKVAPP
jgi:hypothetical protein